MKTGTWYVAGFVVAFVYFYVYAVNYFRGVKADDDFDHVSRRRRRGALWPISRGAGSGGAGGRNQFAFARRRQQQQQHPLPHQAQQHHAAVAPPPLPELGWGYHDYDSMTAYLRGVSTARPELTALYSIGKSVQGKELWVMVVSSSPYRHMVGKPNVKLVANMHGNEAVGREMALHLVRHLVANYETDHYVRWLLDNTRIHVMPSMNPDGFEVALEGTCHGGQGRYNVRGFDLNRNFPDYFKQNDKQSQPETEAVKEWLSKIQFVLSGSMHGGALVASYPFDNTPSSIFTSGLSSPSLTPDNDVFKHLATTYSLNHRTMHFSEPCKDGDPLFPNGTTNGASWYPLTGGMQDYNYIWHGCMEVTLELSCCKYPPSAELPEFWEDNRVALLQFLGEAHRGVKGFVMDDRAVPIEGAAMKVKGRDVGFQTTKEGEFWRILLPGIYTLEVFAEGFEPREVQFAIVDQNPTLLNVTLFRDPIRSNFLASEKKGVFGEEDEAGTTVKGGGVFGLPGAIAAVRKNVATLFAKLPIIGR